MKSPLLAAVSLIALTVLASPALAEVSVCDRNLRITETDLGYSGGLEPSLERFYRSESSRVGLFGRGWTSRYETHVELRPDNSLNVHEPGCSSSTLFRPVPGQSDRWEANRCGLQRIIGTPDGFQRKRADGGTEEFTRDGRLWQITDSNGNWIAIRYDQDRMAQIEDNYGRHLTFTHGDNGRIERVVAESGRETRYGFDNEGRVITVTDPDGGIHRYSYGADGLLSAEDSAKGGRFAATYESGRLASLTENSTIRRFGGHEAEEWAESWEATEDPEGHGLAVSRQVRFFRADAERQGQKWREFSVRDGSETDTEFNDWGLVAIIRDGKGHSSAFRYDGMGRLTHKETQDETVDVAYDPSSGKVSRIEGRAMGSRSWSRFAYDTRGNLIGAANSDGRKISLAYDPQGRISEIAERGKRLLFAYNRESQPTRITEQGGASITVEYDGKGEIASVKSDGGAAMALKVTQTFQSLLTLVRSANVKVGL